MILHRADQLWAAFEWVPKLTAPGEGDALVTNVCPQLAENDPAEAVLAVLHPWALLHSGAAAEWVKLFPKGGPRTRSINEIEGIARFHSETHR